MLAPVIRSDLGLSNLEYASIGTWFLLAYSVCQTLFGKFQDRVGTRLGFAIAMSIWSLAELGHAIARGLFSLSFFRVLLGVGEGGHWPAATKSVAEWFPKQERAFGMGLVNSGAALGSALAPPLIVWLDLRYGWKTTFVVTASLGAVWLVLWLLFYQVPKRHRWISAQERERIELGQGHAEPESAGRLRWRDLLRNRQVWGIVLARFFGDPVWWLYLIWLPLYLHTVRGFSLKEIGLFAWVPYIAADAGALSGGWFSGHLLSRGFTIYRARGTAILLATLLAPAGVLVARAKSPFTAMFLISVVLFAFQFWVNNVQTLPSDLFPTSLVASIAGLSGTAAGVGAMILTLATGWVVDHFSYSPYSPVLVASGLLIPIATGCLFLFARPGRATLSEG